MSKEFCSVCLDFNPIITSIGEVNENNIKWSLKLQSIAPEVDWLEDYLICQNCTKQLDDAYRFKELCLAINDRKSEPKCYEIEENCDEHTKYDDEDFDSDNSYKDEKFIDVQGNNTQELFFICYDCGEKCKTKNLLIKHITSVHKINLKSSGKNHNGRYKNKTFECTKCGRKYVYSATLREHVINCDGIRRHVKIKAEYQCERCGKYYTTKKILEAHLKRCEKEMNYKKTEYQCKKCNKYYISLKTLKDHNKRGCKKDRNNIVNVVFCKICDEYFKTELLLKEHVLAEHKTSEYHCDICIKNFDTKEDYDDHNKSAHVQKTAVNKKRGKVTTRKFTCEVCSEEFNLVKTVMEHCINIHSMEERSIRPYSCEKCDNRFRSSTNLINHRLYHDRNRTNICSFCGKSFITKNDLAAHEYTHYSRRNYKCDKCEKAFKTNTNLRTHHLIVHTDPSLWKYVCHICSKRFPQKSNHDQHLRRHIGEKKFICALCGKPFASKSEMQEHVSYHSNIRAYKCSHCGKEYRKKHTYDVHLAKIHGIGNAKIPIREKKYACHICPSRFYDRLKLARHLCTHSGLKPFPCYACNKKFTDKSYLKYHLKTVHSIVEEHKYTNTYVHSTE